MGRLDGVLGCACDPAVDEDACVTITVDDGRDHDVALVCVEGRWEAVEDGPCMPSGA